MADHIADYVDPSFSNVALLEFVDAWTATLGYTLQLYFDFSAYSEMAMGIALLFGIRLPLNFNSPYKAANISDFWRRWHITLSRFLRDYLYVPLGGNRRGLVWTMLALTTTMVLGGLWHGAGWTFVAWGAMHGAMLVTYKIWKLAGRPMPAWLGRSITFFFVMLGWVLFRANTIQDAFQIWRKMFRLDGIVFPPFFQPINFINAEISASPFGSGTELFLLIALAAFTLSAKNVHEIWATRTIPRWLDVVGLSVGATMACFFLNSRSTFLYWNF